MTWQVSGDTDLALGDREREWDADAARDRIFRWAGWEDDPNPAKAKKAFLAYDAETPTNLTSYKLPFADVVNGELKAMPRGIFAVAQLLRGARDGVDLPTEVLKSVRDRVTAYYRKMGDQPPWNEDGQTQESMPGKMGPAKRAKSQRAAVRAAQTRKRNGTQPHARQMGAAAKKKRLRAARTGAITRAKHMA